MKKSLQLIVLVAIAFGFQSCAAVFTGQQARITVQGMPEGAEVYYNGEYKCDAPCKVTISKASLRDGDTDLVIKKEGFTDAEVVLKSKLMVGAFIFDFLAPPVGHIVDFATGAIFKPFPETVDYKLKVK